MHGTAGLNCVDDLAEEAAHPYPLPRWLSLDDDAPA